MDQDPHIYDDSSAYRRPYWPRRCKYNICDTYVPFGLSRVNTEGVEILYPPWGGGYNPWQYQVPYTPFQESNWSGNKVKHIVHD